ARASFSHSSWESVSCLRVSLSRSYRCSSREHTRPCQSALSCLVSGKSGSPSESRLIRGSWSARAREKRLTSALSTRCANTWQDSKKKWVRPNLGMGHQPYPTWAGPEKLWPGLPNRRVSLLFGQIVTSEESRTQGNG